MEPPRNEAALSSARHGARLPGGAPEPFCERCGTSVEVAAIGPWVGLCHCPACDVFACRWCWEEATEACPECGTRYAPLVVAAAAVAPIAAVAETVPAAGVLAASTPVVASPAATVPVAAAAVPAGEMVGARAATPPTQSAEPAAAAATLQAVRLLRTQRVPAGIGFAVLFVAVFALILGNPFQTGGVQGVLDATDTPSARASGIASEPTANETPDAGGGSVAPATNEPTATDPAHKPTNAPQPTSRPTATPTLPDGAIPAPPTAKPTAAPQRRACSIEHVPVSSA